MLIKADFHIHSCLSPCASLEMSPRDIVEAAINQGLNLIAISDHNSALNAPALNEVVKQYPEINCFFGIEACSIEEIHCLCLFDNLERVMEFSDYLYNFLPKFNIKNKNFRAQAYVDKDNNILGEVEKYLGNALQLKMFEIMELVHKRGGLFVPAHIDRGMYSVISQLGFLPDNNYDAIELNAANFQYSQVKNKYKYQYMLNSDAHYLADIGRAYNIFNAENISIETIRELLENKHWKVKLNI